MNCPYCLSPVVTVIQARAVARCECRRCHRRWTVSPDETPDVPLDSPDETPDESR